MNLADRYLIVVDPHVPNDYSVYDVEARGWVGVPPISFWTVDEAGDYVRSIVERRREPPPITYMPEQRK
ncbi:MAG TPA: hypothetical protein VG476_12590 [Acidimicrobiales bacterium]|nr:hypothetical protein [Acidimicrobiales bacterium]